MRTLLVRSLLGVMLLVAGSVSLRAADTVERFAPFEVRLRAGGTYGNPYVECSAVATLTEPDGRTTRTLPLFWDGGDTWTLRFAPDRVGTWSWAVQSADRGLHGRSGEFTCTASTRRGSLQPKAEAPRHFQYQNGDPVWFLGDTAWALVTDDVAERHDRAAMERYVRNRAAEGFNALHFMLLNEAGWPNSGGPPWHDIAAQTLNPAYFQEADRRVAFANAQGLVTGLALAWGNKGRKEPWSWGRLPDLEARKRYARYVAARYGAYDVYFLVAGEWHGEIRARVATEEAVREEFVQIGNALRAADAHRRMTGIHPMTAHGSTREFAGAAPWMDFADYQQNYRDLHARVLDSRAVARPLVNSEYGYYLRANNAEGRVDKQNSYSVEDMRHATWDIVMAGAYVVTGFGSTYMGGHRHPTPFLPDDPRNAIWAAQLGRVKAFFEGLEYWKLEPRDDLITSGVGRTEDRVRSFALSGGRKVPTVQPAATTYWCLAEPGRGYVAYVRGTHEPLLLQLQGAGPWEVTRHDPRTGDATALMATPAGSTLRLSPPDEQDWVFLVRAGGARLKR